MGKKSTYHFMAIILVLSLSLGLNACSRKSIRGEEVIGKDTDETRMTEDWTSPDEEEELRLKAEQDRAEALRREREEAAGREAALLRAEFENEDIYFYFDEFFLTDEARRILDRKSAWLLDHPRVRIEIEGHCDERGTNEYNLALGEKRAISAMKYLLATGVGSEVMSTISFGEERPVDPGHNEGAWAKNRRAHFRIISD